MFGKFQSPIVYSKGIFVNVSVQQLVLPTPMTGQAIQTVQLSGASAGSAQWEKA